ncbi:MAG: CoA-binding protein [Candidatus Omnitrophica bacterium]|nr:CoA-binding protein [Candidatus Omnitrophota bacterium]
MKDIREKEIVVVGVSEREEKFGHKIFRDLLNNGFKVKGVNPKNGEILGQKVYRSLKDLEIIPDLVITVVSPQITEKIIEECKDLGIKEVWMQPGSESEMAIKKAKEFGISVTYNACFMVENKIW